MNTIAPGTTATTTHSSGEDRVNRAARHLYEAECALHIARQSGVDTWIAAAYDRLHPAVVEYEDARAALTAAPVGRLPTAAKSPASDVQNKEGMQSDADPAQRSSDKTARSAWRFCPRRTDRRGPSSYGRRSHRGCR